MKIVKGCLVPVLRNGKYLSAIEIEDEFTIYNTVLKGTINFIKTLIDEIDNIDDLRNFNDIYVLLIDSLFSNMRRNTAIKLISAIFQKDLTREIEIFCEKHPQQIVHEFLSIPADTRPLANISSLWVHAKTVSALAVIDYITKRGEQSDPEKIELIRFASLFHDIAKPFDRKAHVKEAPKVLNQFFKGYLKEDYLNKVREWITQHHRPDAEAFVKRIQIADYVSSGIERQSDIIKKKLLSMNPTEFGWVKEEFNRWERWQALEDQLISLTELLVNDFRNEIKENLGTIDPSIPPTIALVLGDARGIKEFVDNSLKLKEIKGGAIIVDEALTAQIDSNFNLTGIIPALRNFDIPPECIIFYGGGKILFFADVPRIKEVKDAVKNAFNEATKKGVGLSIAHVEFGMQSDLAFGALYQNLSRKLAIHKMDLTTILPQPIEFGYQKLCSSCGKNVVRPKRIEDDWICDSCYTKRLIGMSKENVRSFNHTWETTYKPIFNQPWEKISNNVLEFIAGWPLKTIIEGNQEKRPLIAVIKADGNNMGEFFGNSFFITELIEKSILTDIALDTCINKLKEIVKNVIHTDQLNKHQEEMLARIDLGIIYAGGDDFLMFAPSWMAIPISVILMEEFNKLLGNQVKLSVGIATGDPKQPQNYLVKAAETLLYNAKQISRNDEQAHKILGYLDYENIEGGIYTPDILRRNRQKLKEDKYIRRPFRIPKWDNKDNYPFNKIIQEMTDKSIESPDELIIFVHDMQREIGMKKPRNRLIEIRNRLLEILSKFQYADFSKDVNYATVFAIYQYSRITDPANEDIKKIYQNIGLSMADSLLKNENVSLLDEFALVKLFGGGYL